jgi:DNA-binding CsgD family transcriptional regulator
MREASDTTLQDTIIRLYEAEPSLRTLPQSVFDGVARLVDADAVGYTEQHGVTHEFRALVSVEDDPAARMRLMQAYARHMHSHPFWLRLPEFFGERALRESDFFSDAEYLALPIAQEAFLPAGAHRNMAIVIPYNGYTVTVTVMRVVGRAAFGDVERDRLQAYRAHLARCYRQAQERTLARLSPMERLRHAFPDLTLRQLDVAAGIADGQSNEVIAATLGVSIETVKAHAKAVYDKIGADGRHVAAVIAHTATPFARLPPLWTLDVGAWGG